jgi:outer membrane receptor protein involved in Fe transport
MSPLLALRLLIVFCVFQYGISTTLAQESEPEEDGFESQSLEHVQVTATRSNQRDIDIAAAVTLVNESEILEKAPDVIAEMLRGEIGTFFQQTTPGQGVPIIRGLKGSQILHMVDGIRLNNAFFRNAPNQYLGLVDSFSAQRMEVVRGSQGALYGADAMGGVLNILTQEPDFKGPDWQMSNRLYGSYDSVDNGLVLSARSSAGNENWGFVGGASYQDHANRTSGNGDELIGSAYKSKAADLKFIIDTSERSSLMLSAQVMEQPSTPRHDELVPGYGQDEPDSEQFAFKPNRREFLQARFRLQGDSGWFDQFEANVARQVITDDRLNQDFGSDQIRTEENESTLDGATVQFNSTLFEGTPLVWGAEFYTDKITSHRYTQSEGSDIKTEIGSRFPDGSSMDSAAIYLSGEWYSTDNFDLNAGLRYSWFDIRLPDNPDYAKVKLTPSALTGDIHFVYALNESVKLVSNIGQGFRPPNIFDLATLGPRPGNRFNVVNTDLQPETVWSYDLGFKVETDTLEMEIFGFYLDYSDKITSVFTGEVTPEGRFVVQSENLNEMQLYGIEFGIYGILTDNIEPFAVLNYTRGEEQEESGQMVPADRIPPFNGQVGLNYNFMPDWNLEPYVMFASRQDRLSPRDESDPRINPMGTGGWATFNVLLEWQTTEQLQLGLRLENLTAKQYREHASGIDAAGRNIGMWVNYTFP